MASLGLILAYGSRAPPPSCASKMSSPPDARQLFSCAGFAHSRPFITLAARGFAEPRRGFLAAFVSILAVRSLRHIAEIS